ncbi:dTDP-4-oxo-6-deoxy-D-allose reductase [Polaribacter huanghezhanensis]|uniref:SDR family oxidoreductase n=1 Tax=Polaribacter huanghezhanensis TaxID=1354726 RepID=UPI0026473F77|nr:SDR family oxidoreductase [Polaribacter huanghezhanensis]WKD85416.1 dTDP-4-oxo-6-deoxy-D-allose reductase [Polaribacter huanghezhanensis]
MILVTGGTGLVGSHLLYQLTAKNEKIKAIYRTEKSFEALKRVFSYFTDDVDSHFSKIDWVQADITDVPSLTAVFKEITIVYHAAALVSFDEKEYRKMRQINIEGTANIVNQCIANSVKKLCYVSSIAAIGDAINNEIVTEENEWNTEANNNGYAITKHGAEMEVWRGSQEGIDVVIVNPGVILGAGFWDINTGQFFSKAAKGFKYFTEGVTGFVGVEDVAKAMIQLTESSVKNEQFILVSENNSFREIFTFIANQFGKKPPTIRISRMLSKILRRMDAVVTFITRKKRLITKDSVNSLHGKTQYSSEKFTDTIGFTFESTKQVIEEVCAIYKKEKNI